MCLGRLLLYVIVGMFDFYLIYLFNKSKKVLNLSAIALKVLVLL